MTTASPVQAGSVGSATSKDMSFLLKLMRSTSATTSTCTAFAKSFNSSTRLCKWFSLLKVQTQRTWTTKTSSKFTSQLWTSTALYTLASFYLREGSPWWKKSSCWAALGTVPEFCANVKMCSQSESVKICQLVEWKCTAHAAKMSIYLARNNWTLMALTSAQVFHTFF